MKIECRGLIKLISLFCLLAATAIFLAGCTTSAQSKADHVKRGEAYLKDEKFQEASLEFRNAIQIDGNLAAAHWGLARAFEGLQRGPELVDELKKTIALDPNNLDARLKLGNLYIIASRGDANVIAAAERIAQDILQKDPNNIEGHILMGSVFFNQNQKDKALEEFNHAIQIDPSRVESYLSLSRFYIVNKEFDKAEANYKKAISVNNNSALAHTLYGQFLAASNRLPEAEAEYRKAVEVDPKDKNARFMLASYYLGNKQLDKAEESFKALAALDPNKPQVQAMLGDFYAAANRPDDAIRVYQDILAKSPDFAKGRSRLTEIFMGKGDFQNANAQIEEALKKDEHDREAILLRARMKGQRGQQDDLKSAVEDLKEVLRQDPNSQLGLFYMAQFNANLGLLDEARTFASDLEKKYPDYLPPKLLQIQLALIRGDQKAAIPLAGDLLARLDKAVPGRDNTPAELLREIRMKTYLARGTAELQLKNSAAARKDFESARDADPNSPSVYNSLALVSLAENKPQDAVNLFETALKIDPTNPDALNGLLNIYARTQEFDKAHARLDQALAAYPNNASLHYLKALAYGAQRNSQSAEAELNKALELDPNYLAAYYSLASLYINTKQEDRAIAEFQKVVARRPENATAYTMIGMLEDQRKNYDAAADNYRKALEKEPNSIIAANNLAWLYAVTGKGNLDEAVRLAQGVVQRNPGVAGFVDTLGWVYYKKNLNSAAVEQLRQAVSLNEADARKSNGSPSATYHFHLGMALKVQGDKGEARRQLETAIRLSDKSPFADVEEAKKALASL